MSAPPAKYVPLLELGRAPTDFNRSTRSRIRAVARAASLTTNVLWVTFGLRSGSLEASPSIEYFPTERDEDEYYEGLVDADLNRPERIRAFYLQRLLALFDDS